LSSLQIKELNASAVAIKGTSPLSISPIISSASYLKLVIISKGINLIYFSILNNKTLNSFSFNLPLFIISDL
jgi:hypothetical protein